MAGKPKRRLTPLETLVMNAVWDDAPATVRQVKERIRDAKPLAYNTVLTVMRKLRGKGFLSSTRQGRLDVYRPLVTRNQAAHRSLNELLESFFEGSAQALVSHLLDSEEITTAETAAIRREVDKKLRRHPEEPEV